MQTAYERRMNSYKQSKSKAFTDPSLPKNRPVIQSQEPVDTSVKITAGRPVEQKSEPSIPDGKFKNMVSHYGSKDSDFPSEMQQFMAAIEEKKSEYEGINLPEPVKQKIVEDVLASYKNRSKEKFQTAEAAKTMQAMAQMGQLNNMIRQAQEPRAVQDPLKGYM